MSAGAGASASASAPASSIASSSVRSPRACPPCNCYENIGFPVVVASMDPGAAVLSMNSHAQALFDDAEDGAHGTLYAMFGIDDATTILRGDATQYAAWLSGGKLSLGMPMHRLARGTSEPPLPPPPPLRGRTSGGVELSASLREGERCMLIVCRVDRTMTISIVSLRGPMRTLLVNCFGRVLPTDLLSRMVESMPADASDASDAYGLRVAVHFVTVMFVDIVGFTSVASKMRPKPVFEFLAGIFRLFEGEVSLLPDVITYETDGDCWVGVAGIAHRDPDHDTFSLSPSSDGTDADADPASVRSSMDLTEAAGSPRRAAPDGREQFRRHSNALSMFHLGVQLQQHARKMRMPDGQPLVLRCGIHSGMVGVGIMASRMKLAGDTVNTAQRVEAACPTGMVNLSDAAHALLPEYVRSLLVPHTAQAKGKGEMSMHMLAASIIDTLPT